MGLRYSCCCTFYISSDILGRSEIGLFLLVFSFTSSYSKLNIDHPLYTICILGMNPPVILWIYIPSNKIKEWGNLEHGSPLFDLGYLEGESSIQDMKMSFFQTLSGWSNASGVLSFSSLADMLDRCTLFSAYAYLSTCSLCSGPFFVLVFSFNEVYYLSIKNK